MRMSAKTSMEEPGDFLHADFEQKRMFFKKILADLVKVGFLMVFCESQYCTENIRFVVAVEKYRTLFENDGFVWGKYQDLDELPKSERKDKPVCNDRILEVQKDIKFIDETFLAASAKLEICMPTRIAESTVRRMKEYKCYGPEVFKEACIDPTDTMIKDILPRYVVSQCYQDSLYYVTKMLRLPGPNTIKVTPPQVSYSELCKIMDSLQTDEDIRHYTADDVSVFLTDPLLYNQFLKYLTRIHCSENLLCIRSIEIFTALYDEYIASGFKEKILSTAECARVFEAEDMSRKTGSKPPDVTPEKMLRTKIIAQAWCVFLYFVTPDACFEVGLSHKLQNSVERNMAAPGRDIFAAVKTSAYKVLAEGFHDFKNSPCFQPVFQMCKDRQLNRAQVEAEHRAANRPGGAAGCLW
jgi:hypothetical protein